MASLNKVFLMGNLTRDVELRYTPGGAAVCEFGLAVNRKYESNGQIKDETCFIDITVWGKQAESCNKYLSKGSQALIEGRLQFDQWDDRETGKKRSKLTVVAERVQFIGKREDNAQQGASQGEYNQDTHKEDYNQTPPPAICESVRVADKFPENNGTFVDTDDIPF